MTTTISSITADLIGDYLDGRWDRIDRLHQQQALIAINGDRASILDLLTCLSPLKVLTNSWESRTAVPEGLFPSQLLRIRTCRWHLLQALAALSLGDSTKVHASTTSFCAFFFHLSLKIFYHQVEISVILETPKLNKF